MTVTRFYNHNAILWQNRITFFSQLFWGTSVVLDPASTQHPPSALWYRLPKFTSTGTQVGPTLLSKGAHHHSAWTLWDEQGWGASEARILERTGHVIAIKKRGLVWKGDFTELGMPRAWGKVLLTISTAQTIRKWNNGTWYVPVNLMGKLNAKWFMGAVLFEMADRILIFPPGVERIEAKGTLWGLSMGHNPLPAYREAELSQRAQSQEWE